MWKKGGRQYESKIKGYRAEERKRRRKRVKEEKIANCIKRKEKKKGLTQSNTTPPVSDKTHESS